MSKGRLLFKSFIIAFLFTFLIGCGHNEPVEKIDFSDTTELQKASATQNPKINICIGSMITPEEGYAFYKKLLDYIGKRLGLDVRFVEKRTYGEVNALLKSGGIDMAFVCGGPYVEGCADFGLELLVAPMVKGETVYYSYIIVRKDSGINRIGELRGKAFAFADPLSNTGRLIPTYMLQKQGETPEGFFKETPYTYSHDRSIKAVAQGVVDGAGVDSLIWEYMKKKGCKYTSQTKIIKISDPYGIPPVVVRPGLSESLKTKLKYLLLNIDGSEEGKEILKGMSIDRFVEVDDSSYNGIREVISYLKKTKI